MAAPLQTGTPHTDPEPGRFSKHKPGLALFLSLIFAGLGQFYNRKYIKGLIFLVLEAAFITIFYWPINIGLWGLWTLGTIPGLDDSILLLVQGIVMLIVLLAAIFLHILNIRDAFKQAKKLKATGTLGSFRENSRTLFHESFPYILNIPAAVLIMFSLIFPLLFAVLLGFTNYNLYHAPPRHLVDWVGLKNFVTLFTSDIWRKSLVSVLSWTVIWTIVATTLQIIVGLFLAVIVNDKRIKFKKTIRTVLILPWAIPAFVSILIFRAMFNDGFGAINNEILIPLLGHGLPWITVAFYTKIALIMIQIWLGFPFLFALFTGVLQSASPELYEAADVDGGTKWQKFRFITMPHVLYATAPLLITQYAQNFNNFNMIYLFNDGGPPVEGQKAGGTDILISWVYKLTFESNQYGMAAAISIVMGLIVIAISWWQFRKTAAFKEEL